MRPNVLRSNQTRPRRAAWGDRSDRASVSVSRHVPTLSRVLAGHLKEIDCIDGQPCHACPAERGGDEKKSAPARERASADAQSGPVIVRRGGRPLVAALRRRAFEGIRRPTAVAINSLCRCAAGVDCLLWSAARRLLTTRLGTPDRAVSALRRSIRTEFLWGRMRRVSLSDGSPAKSLGQLTDRRSPSQLARCWRRIRWQLQSPSSSPSTEC